MTEPIEPILSDAERTALFALLEARAATAAREAREAALAPVEALRDEWAATDRPSPNVSAGWMDAAAQRLDAALAESGPPTALREENALLRSLLAPYIAEDVREVEAEAARNEGNVRCLRCDLRYEERQEYGCREEARAHDYDEHELAEARFVGPMPRTVDEVLAEARAAQQEGADRG